MKTKPTSTASGVKRLRKKSATQKKPPRISNSILAFIILSVFFIGLLLSGAAQTLFSKIYHPVSFIVLILLIVEYILLKGRDRSRIYRIELDQLHQKRNDDLRQIRDWEKQLEQIETLSQQLDSDQTQTESSTPATQNSPQELQEKIQNLREELSNKL